MLKHIRAIQFKFIFVFFCFSLALNIQNTFSQKYISDSLIIPVPADTTLAPVRASLKEFHDLRRNKEKAFRITQKQVYYFFPVDYYIIPNKTMKEYFSQLFRKDTLSSLSLDLYKFSMEEQKSRIFKRYVLNAEIGVQKFDESSGTNDTLSGRLIYETKVSFRGTGKVRGAKELKLLSQWEKEFSSDISQILRYKQKDSDILPYNLRPVNDCYKTNLYSSARFIFGLDFWMIEGELMFSGTEVNPRFFRQGYIVRYRNNEVLESIAFGGKSEHFDYRFNNRWIFDLNTNFLIGVNKWKDMNEADHPLWHVVMLDLSIAQYIRLTPLNSKPSWIIGGGFMEDFYYIPDGDFKFNPGIAFQLGYRF